MSGRNFFIVSYHLWIKRDPAICLTFYICILLFDIYCLLVFKRCYCPISVLFKPCFNNTVNPFPRFATRKAHLHIKGIPCCKLKTKIISSQNHCAWPHEHYLLPLCSLYGSSFNFVTWKLWTDCLNKKQIDRPFDDSTTNRVKVDKCSK